MTIELRDRIRAIPDFPVAGVLYRDITPLLADHAAFDEAVRRMCEPWTEQGVELVAAMEARGFMFAAPMALQLGCGVVPVRKPGKLPARTLSVEYELEYRKDRLEIHADAVRKGQRVLVVDDVLATGGTAAAVLQLLRRLEAEVAGFEFLLELTDLHGRDLLPGWDVRSVLTY